jgi:hypothetical protein
MRKLGESSKQILDAIDRGLDTLKLLFEHLEICPIYCRSIVTNMRKQGIVEMRHKTIVIIDTDWYTYPTSKAGPKKDVVIQQKQVVPSSPPLETNIKRLAQLMCWTLDRADEHGIKQIEIDWAKVMEACRNEKPEFRIGEPT